MTPTPLRSPVGAGHSTQPLAETSASRRRAARRSLAVIAVLALLVAPSFVEIPTPIGAFVPGGVSHLRAGATAAGALARATASLRSGDGPVAAAPWGCPPTVGGTVRCTSSSSSGPAAGNVTGGWIAGPTTPAQGLLAFDARDGYDFLMAEAPASNVTAYYEGAAQYFAFEGGRWTPLSVVGGPLFCGTGSLAYDSTDRDVVFLGGKLCRDAGDTWTYQGGSWSNVTNSSMAPPATLGAALADYPHLHGLLYFGGCCSGTNATGGWTWGFANGTWGNLSIFFGVEPPAESYGAMAYDTHDTGVVLVEGVTAQSFYEGYATWFFNGSWHAEPKPTVPNTYTRIGPALADDPSDGYVLMVPSVNGTVNRTGASYHYANGTWTNGTPHAGLAESLFPAMAYNSNASVASELLLEGFSSSLGIRPATTWMYQGGNWTNASVASNGPGPRADIAMTYDAADGYVVAFGGCRCQPNLGVPGQSDTWKFAGGNWTELATNASPPARSLAGLVYDAADGYVLLFGGVGSSGALNDTWEFTAGGWTQITPTSAPPWYQGETMAYDGSDNDVVLLTGWIPASTWTYHAGVWTNLTALGDRTIDGGAANPIAYDPALGEVVLFGTAHAQPSYSPYLESDTWTFRGGNWTNATPAKGPEPPARSDASVASFPPGGFVLLYGGSQAYNALSTPLNDTWAYNGTWTRLAPAVSPGNRSDMFGTYDPADSEDVFYGGWYGQFSPVPLACTPDGPCGDSWFWSGGSASAPLIQAFAASPPTLDLGVATHFSVSVIGGVAPFSYAYTHLPTGCGSANASELTCTPTATGTWTVDVLATDAMGHSAASATILTVQPALQLTAFFATPASGQLAERTLLSVQYSHGTPPLSYVYSGLPSGCTTQDVPTLPCIPAASGNFTVRVALTDAGGGAANGSLNLSVGAAGTAGPLRITGYRFAPATLVLGNASTISVNATSPSGPLSYAYGNLPPGCASSNASALSCRPTSAGTYGVSISVRDAAGDLAVVGGNLTVDPVGGGAGLSIAGFGAAPGLATVGSTVVLSVVATGGSGALTFRYPTLPAGCASANTSALPCSPSAPGNYSLYVVVTDAAAHSRGAVGSLVVVPSATAAPAVSAFFASPENVTIGNATTFIVEARGTLPFSYAYTGLPTGCSSGNTSILNCTSTDLGIFPVTVRVTDPTGRSVTATTTLGVWSVLTQPRGPPVSYPPRAVAAEPVLLWVVLGTVVGAAVALLGAELGLHRRRLRKDGEAIVRELARRPDGSPPSPPERTRP